MAPSMPKATITEVYLPSAGKTYGSLAVAHVQSSRRAFQLCMCIATATKQRTLADRCVARQCNHTLHNHQEASAPLLGFDTSLLHACHIVATCNCELRSHCADAVATHRHPACIAGSTTIAAAFGLASHALHTFSSCTAIMHSSVSNDDTSSLMRS